MICPQFGSHGGAERQAQRLTTALVARGVPVVVIAEASTANAGLSDDGFRLIRVLKPFSVRGLRRFSTALYCVVAYWWIRRNASTIRVVHAHIVSAQALAAGAAARAASVPAIVKVSSSGANADYRRYLANPAGLDRFLRRFSAVVATSTLAARELEALGVPLERIALVPNGLPAVRPDAEVPGRGRRVVCVASLRTIKDHATLLSAWAIIPASSRDGWTLTLAGSGPEESRLREQCLRLGIERSVEFLGEVSDVGALLQGSSIFTLTSRAEGMSNALLEAMAASLPCVVTDVGSNAEVLGEAGREFLCPAGDSGCLAAKMGRLMDSRDTRRDIGSALKARVTSEYSMDRVCSTVLDLYDSLGPSDSLEGIA